MPRASMRVGVRPRDVLAEARRSGGTGRRCAAAGSARASRRRRPALGDRPAVSLVDEPGDERADGVGQRLLDGLAPTPSAEPRRPSTAAAPAARRPRAATVVGRTALGERDVAGLQRQLVRDHLGRERGVDEALDRRHAAVARRQLQHPAAAAPRAAGSRASTCRRRCRGTGRSPASGRRR